MKKWTTNSKGSAGLKSRRAKFRAMDHLRKRGELCSLFDVPVSQMTRGELIMFIGYLDEHNSTQKEAA